MMAHWSFNSSHKRKLSKSTLASEVWCTGINIWLTKICFCEQSKYSMPLPTASCDFSLNECKILETQILAE